MGIQKSLILNFDARSARESAEQDWKFDLERETAKRPAGSNVAQPIEELSESEEESELDSDAESEQI